MLLFAWMINTEEPKGPFMQNIFSFYGFSRFDVAT